MVNMLIATLVLWVLFIMVANLKNHSYSEDLPAIRKYPILLFGYTFLAVDVAYNYTYAAILFLEPASNQRKTLTLRLKHYLQTQPDTWRGKMAQFFCRYMIEPWDFGHCGLNR